MIKMCRKFSIYVIFLFFLSSPIIAAPKLGERYPAPWRDDFNSGITKALVAGGIRGCGEYKYRPSAIDRSEYLVYCTRDGRRWMAYIVWPNIKQVMGPYEPDSSIN